MSDVSKRKLFVIAVITCGLLLTVASFGDLAISNTMINYNSVFGTIFQTFGEFPVYFIFVLSGEVAIVYAIRCKEDKLFAVPLFLGGFSLSAWQIKQYLNEVSSYSIAALTNIHNNKSIGLANSDAATASLSTKEALILWLVVYICITLLIAFWLKNKSDEQIKKYLLIGIFASLTVWFSLEVNGALKDFWGRVRPYELSASQHDFTSWLHPNGVNGHKSFPSGHTMSGTLCIVFSWFATGIRRRRLWIFGVVYGAVLGLSRLIIGAHFLSDIVFSYFLTAFFIFIMRSLYDHIIEKNLKLH
ncbi:membrane-associated phospholipid phosphatase [Liquorilactobacillus aquaticus DSM 21051]|uniref:Membrane-associated phospholipid phosphatase n=1 Tax=Liquorilactobacillus aquaticus DSM 21051 TaxID=1423725 RepID=A0A0R2D2M0_9LACO|nr:phosphatase PAP2 family protein [Liquorilactobacillus aquaticus]KRM97594.1 membrane-associated phospholipid phosphatase [Liquorilactobacillus aquaticus DSM 21051]